MIERIGGKSEVRSAVSDARREGRSVGFVATMGALHEGHLALVRAAKARTEFLVTSVFVNPTQFAPGEDFEQYPRDLEADALLLESEGVDVLFAPTPAAMYGANPQVTVDPGPLAQLWEGASRPTHFAGVATVVAKLFNIVEADLAFFGEKDYQQFKIVEKMAHDLDLRTQPVSVPIVRDCDGLALSSRNRFLSGAERQAALTIPSALEAAAAELAWGDIRSAHLEDVMRGTLAAGVEPDYVAIVDPDTLQPVEQVTGPVRAIIAARVGSTRLIDNCELVPSRSCQ